ncbi:MAG: chromosome segregation protein SMC, partial [Anaerovorax sp.]
IVGPNGSGKSNISDAIRWVLGEQSPKILRGGKMEEVIFAGTANRKSKGMAEVTLVIDNSKNILPIDYGEVAITRRMYRSGESEYSINKNQCRLKDVRELIMDTGIGVDGYSLIGQGKIADIVSNKTESRREIFEEAAGIVKYRSKKAESERKLVASRANLERVNDIVAEIEGRIGGLKEDSQKATEYLSLRERYRELEINVTLKNIENVESKSNYLKEDLAEMGGRLDSLKEEKKNLDLHVHTNRMRNEELDTRSNNMRDQLLESTAEISNLINRAQLNKEKLITMSREKDRLRGEIQSLEEKIEKEEMGSREIFGNKEKIEAELIGLEQVLRDKRNFYTEKTGALSRSAVDIDLSKNSVYELYTSVSNKNSEINSLTGLQNTLNKRKAQILAEKEMAHIQYRQMDQSLEDAQEENRVLLEKIAFLSEKGRKETIIYNESVTKERRVAKEVEACNVEIGQVSTRKKMIEEMESNYEGYNHAVKFIMKSNLSKINGVVAELIHVPHGFETAMETALGAAMQNIVCEDDQSAQAAVSLLKAKKAGRLTFLPITSIKSFGQKQNDSLRDAVGFKGFGVECIEFQPKYKGVMDYLLGRVVVVDKLENAVKLSKKTGGG